MHHLAAADQLELAWSAGIGTGSAGEGQLLARPVVAAGRVFTMDAEGRIRAFDAENGDLVWEFAQAEESEDGLIGGGLAYADGWLFATLSSGYVVALDAASGTEMWRQSLGVPLRAAPTVAEGRILVLTADNQLYALEGTTGRPIWRHAGFFEGTGLLGCAEPGGGPWPGGRALLLGRGVRASASTTAVPCGATPWSGRAAPRRSTRSPTSTACR